VTAEGLWRIALALFVLIALQHSCHALRSLERIAAALERAK
jgi:hypothetical protein